MRRTIVVGALLGLVLGCAHALLQQQVWGPVVGVFVGAGVAAGYVYLRHRREQPPSNSEPDGDDQRSV